MMIQRCRNSLLDSSQFGALQLLIRVSIHFYYCTRKAGAKTGTLLFSTFTLCSPWFVSFTCTMFLVAFIYFLDIIFDYSETLFDFFQSFIAYLFACAGISYLTNMILIILLDVGKHKWHMNQQQLNKMRWYVHWVTGLANCAVIVQFIVIFLINLDEDKKIKSPDHEKVMILYSINVFLICSVSLLQWWHFRYRIKSV